MMLRLTGRPRLIAAVAVGCAALLVPAVALAAPAGSQSPATARCGGQSTEVWLGLNPDGAAAGTTYYPLEFTNVGRHSCTLAGYPAVWATNSSGQSFGRRATDGGGAKRTITLKSGQSAHAELGIVQAGFISTCHNVTGRGLAVRPPGQSQSQPIESFSFPACSNNVKYLYVSRMRAGVGIP